jgi:hypothetical protein
MSDPTSLPERRRLTRRHVLKAAHIDLNNGGAAISCMVRNLSDLGACLEVPNHTCIPNAFALLFDHASVFQCRVVWRKATQIGVLFD